MNVECLLCLQGLAVVRSAERSDTDVCSISIFDLSWYYDVSSVIGRPNDLISRVMMMTGDQLINIFMQ